MKRAIKIIAAVLAALTLTMCLSACGSAKTPEAAVEGLFDALKDQNMVEAAKYVDLESIENLISDKSKLDDAQMFLKEIGKKLEYEIISSEEVDENTAKVKAKVTSIDMAAVMKNYITKGMQYSISSVFGSGVATDEENEKYMEELFMECMSDESVGTVTNEIDITVQKQDGNWKVNADNTFNDALLGGITNTAESIVSEFGNALLGSLDVEE